MFKLGTHDFVSALKLLPLDHHKVVGIASRDSNKAEDFAEKLGIEQAFGNYSELAESDNVGTNDEYKINYLSINTGR